MALNLGWLAIILYADAIYSPGGSGFVYLATSARVLWALPHNGYGPKVLSRLNRFAVPAVSLVVTLILSVLALLPFPAWSRMVGIATSFGVITYMMGGVSALVMRRTAPNLPRIRVRGIRVLGLLSFIFGGLIVYWTAWPSVFYVAIAMAVGFVVYLIYHVKLGYTARDLTAGIWFLGMMAFLAIMSYLGSFGGIKAIEYPWDLVVVALGSVGFYFWAVRSGFMTQDMREFIEEQDQAATL